MKNFISEGNSLQVAAGINGVRGGEIKFVGAIVGIALADAQENEKFTLKVTGAYSECPKVAAESWGIGEKLYLQTDTNLLSKTESQTTLYAGNAYESSQAGDATCSLLLLR